VSQNCFLEHGIDTQFNVLSYISVHTIPAVMMLP